jgi:molecular chaperone IbpA
MTFLRFNTSNVDLENFFKIAVPNQDFFERVNKFGGQEVKYPPYNMYELDRYTTRLELALAGWSKEDIEVEFEKNSLRIMGKKNHEDAAPNALSHYHQGIASRAFKVELPLYGTHKVRSANLVNGILTIDVEEIVPEEDRPRKIEIGTEKCSSDTKKEFLTE